MKKQLIFLLPIALILISGCGTAAKPYNATSVVTNTVDVTVNETAIRLIDENGVHYGLEHIENRIRVVNDTILYEIAEGKFPDHFAVRKFGLNETVSGSFETLWAGSNLYTYMTVADQLEVLSSSGNDILGGTGAITVELLGLDASYNNIAENVTMNGTTFVLSTKTYIRIPRAIVHTAGATGWNVGTITIRDQDTDTTRQLISPFKNQTLFGGDTCPAGFTCFITSWYVGSTAGKDAQVELYIRPFGEVFQVKRNIHLRDTSYSKEFDFPQRVAEKSDIELRAMATGGGGDISGGFLYWREKN